MAMFKELYQCSFCRLDFIRLPVSKLRLADKLLGFLGFPLHQCPHCFSCCHRPGLPFGKKKEQAASQQDVAENLAIESDTDGDCGPVIVRMNKELVSSSN